MEGGREGSREGRREGGRKVNGMREERELTVVREGGRW